MYGKNDITKTLEKRPQILSKLILMEASFVCDLHKEITFKKVDPIMHFVREVLHNVQSLRTVKE